MNLDLKRDFYKRFKFVFDLLPDIMEIIVLDKNNSNKDVKSWTETSYWAMNEFRGIKTLF